ncbi:MAG: hypothetical protein R3Y61_05570 [Rikenellaceae bacterium]
MATATQPRIRFVAVTQFYSVATQYYSVGSNPCGSRLLFALTPTERSFPGLGCSAPSLCLYSLGYNPIHFFTIHFFTIKLAAINH